MSLPRYINGRILLREHGGVQRYAAQIAHHLDDAVVLKPRSAKRAWSARVWEQTTLARASADGVLLNMAHSAPRRHPRQVNVLYDLLALTNPQGVHPAYAALLRRQLPAYVSSARRLATISNHVAEQIARQFDVRLGDIIVVPPGISPVFQPDDPAAAKTRLGLDPDRPVVAALLDPVPRKNSPAVARLLLELQLDDPAIQVVVAGRHDAPRFARSNASATSNRAAFIDLGSASDIELASMYQAADVYVALSRGEGFGLPVVEAAVCGAAVVSTAVPSLTEHAPGAAVLVTDEREAMAAVAGLLRNPTRCRELGENAQEALGDLQWSRSATTLGTVMSEVAST